jgi:hypothetical protein
MKFIYFLLVIFFNSISLYSQKEKNFLDFEKKFIEVKLPLVLDDYFILDVSKEKELSYDCIKNILLDETGNCFISINDTISNKFYANGRTIIFDDYKGLIFSHVNTYNSQRSISVFLAIFDKNNMLLRMNTLAYKSTLPISEERISLLYPNVFYQFIKAEKKEYDINSFVKKNNDYDGLKKEDGFIFSCYNYEEDHVLDKTPIDVSLIPTRNLDLIFDLSFFEKEKMLVPLKFCSPISNSQVLAMINKENKESISSYFIDSKKNKNGDTIIIFFNKYKFKSYNNVSEVGYLIIDSNGKLRKKDSFSEYITKSDGTLIRLKEGKIVRKKNEIQIISTEKGVSEVEVFKI